MTESREYVGVSGKYTKKGIKYPTASHRLPLLLRWIILQKQ